MSLFASGIVSASDWIIPLKYAAAASVLALGLAPSAQAAPTNPWEAVEYPRPGRLSTDTERSGEQAWFVPVGKDAEGHDVQVELMVPGSMIRMIVSAQSEAVFGFGPRVAPASASAPTA